MKKIFLNRVVGGFLLVSAFAIVFIYENGPDDDIINTLCSVVVIFSLISAIIVFYKDPYRKDYDASKNKTEIYHPRTHATLALLALVIVAVPLIEFSVTAAKTPPFIFAAFFIGTIGGAMGVLHRMDFSTIESQLLFENMQRIQNQADSQNDTETYQVGEVGFRFKQSPDKDKDGKAYEKQYASVVPQHCLSLYGDMLFNCYRSIAVAGVFAIFGLIVLTAFGNSLEISMFEHPVGAKQSQTCQSSDGQQTQPENETKSVSTSTLSCWLNLRPNNYGFALFICILFGYSQRLWSSILNRAEEMAIEYVDVHPKLPDNS